MNVRNWLKPHSFREGGSQRAREGDDQLSALALFILQERDRRMWFLPKTAFGETAWEVVLLLYCSETKSLSLDSLSNATLAEPSSVGRWVDFLEDEGLVSRSSSNSAILSSEVQLTLKGMHALDLYLSDRYERSRASGFHSRTTSGEATSKARGQTVALAGLVGAVIAGVTCSIAV